MEDNCQNTSSENIKFLKRKKKKLKKKIFEIWIPKPRPPSTNILLAKGIEGAEVS